MTLIYIEKIFELIFYNNDVRFIILKEATAENQHNTTHQMKAKSHKIIVEKIMKYFVFSVEKLTNQNINLTLPKQCYTTQYMSVCNIVSIPEARKFTVYFVKSDKLLSDLLILSGDFHCFTMAEKKIF